MGGQLHLVKYIYIDDDGNLVAQAWSGIVSIGIPVSLLGKPGGVAKLNNNGKIPAVEIPPFVPEMDHLPSPGPEYEGMPLRVKLPGTGTKTELYTCVVNSQDEYEWVKLSEST